MQKSGRLELTWAGKSYETESFEPRLLVEDKEKSYGDDSPNMLIHGDNLLALKALELDYMEAVQCIYIDPPFNTGGRIDASGQEIGYDDGLEHSIWLDMHTFAHLMIKQMSMSSGYSSSAIRERIYFGDKMSGILLYTGSSDKEGSLGGLVELGNIDQMTNLMRDAFQEALVCTNDPECMSNLPAGKNSNGAACHSCCMISETACENGNRMLDRGLVVPIPEREECSYFKELVSELCQVEI